MGKYQVEFTLCRLAAIAISKQLWQSSAVLKDELGSCIEGDADPEEAMPSAVKFVMDQFLVPKAAKEELMFAVGLMGWEMWEEFWHLKWKYLRMAPEDSLFTFEAIACVDYVCWTTDGCLNTPETIRSLYFAGMLRDSFATWEELCTYCLEDCINNFWYRTSTSGYSNWRDRRRNTSADFEFQGILTAYWVARVGNDFENAIDVVFRELPDQFYDDAYSLDENMFINSFVQNRYWAVKFFWGSLNENQRRRMIATICEKIMSNDPRTKKYKDLFFAERGLTPHSLMFFLQHLSNYGFDDVRIRILGSGFMLVNLLEWPYDNLFFETLKEASIYHNSIDYGPIISRICHNISQCKEYQFIDEDVKYHRIFYRIWEMNPLKMKDSVDYQNCLVMFVQSGNVDLLNHILNDRELNDRREKFLNEIVGFVLCGEADDYFLPDFLMNALVCDEEREWFRRQIVLGHERGEGMDVLDD